MNISRGSSKVTGTGFLGACMKFIRARTQLAQQSFVPTTTSAFFSRPLPPMGDLWGYFGSRLAGVVARTATCRLQPDSE